MCTGIGRQRLSQQQLHDRDAALRTDYDPNTPNYYNANTPNYFDANAPNYFDANAPNLLSLLELNAHWAATMARIESHPSETRAVGMQGRAPLHVACDQDAPAIVIRALLKAYPESSTMVGTSNMNPLHITCSSQHASEEVIRVLLEGGLAEQARMRDVDGDTPLHAACRCGAPIEVLDVLLRAYPGAVHERDYEGLTPLLRLWVRYVVTHADAIEEGISGPDDLTGELGEAWKKTELLLRCAHHGSAGLFSNGLIFRAVHAASAVDCPRQVVKIAATCYPHQIEERDENGLTPLLIASQTPIFKVQDLSDNGYSLEDVIHGDEGESNASSQEEDDNYGANNSDNNQHDLQPSVIQILLQGNEPEVASSAAGMTNSMGWLPLHLALSTGKGWNEGIKDLVEVHPDSLIFPVPQCKLYPFMLAGVDDNCDLDTVYELLRYNPGLIRD